MNPLPSGVEQESSGDDAKVMQDVFSGFAGAVGTAVQFIYAVLLLFTNFLHPVTIMAALALSLGGALLGLLVGQKSLGLYALIGVVLLMGIVTKIRFCW
jgi:multidrug efflux pump subunit AcrB